MSHEQIDVPRGWGPLVGRLIEELQVLGAPAITQAKQKFGKLRVYFAGELSPQAQDAVVRAVKLSEATCEECGGAGTLKRRHAIRVLCDTCSDNVPARQP